MKLFSTLAHLLTTGSLLLPLVSFSQSTTYQSPCSELVWYDEFNGTTLDSRWTPQIGDGCDINLCGWGNAEAQYYTGRTENVKVENGNLVITAIKEDFGGKSYTSARLRSINQGDFTFGRIEARMKMPQGAGSWPAFWMLPTDNTYGPWPTSGEIDIMEYQGKTPNTIAGTAHYGNAYPDNQYRGQIKTLPSGQYFYDDFHVFSVEWDSTQIRWYMDGTQYYSLSKTQVYPYTWPYDQRFHILLNMAVGGHLGGTVNDATLPWTFLIDYVRVYTTPLNVNILGKNKVYYNDTYTYTVPGDPTGNTYAWSVPADATIVSGQGTNTITVQWGTTSGNVSVVFTKPCDDFTLTYPVSVFNPDGCVHIFDDFDNNRNMTYRYSYGSFLNPNSNPVTNGINSSAKCGRYTRTTHVSDEIIFTDIIALDAAAFEAGTKMLFMDVLVPSSVPIGTKIEIQMQNSLKVNGTYPAGRRGSFVAYTSKQSTWERLLFTYVETYDATTLPAEIDQLSILFDPGSTNSKAYFFDNLRMVNMTERDITAPGGTSIPCSSTAQQYSVPVVSGSSYTWSVPAGASIVSGQGTEQITVDWGTTSGYITVTEVNASCTDMSGALRVSLTGCNTTGVNHGTALLQGARVYPNPTHGYATVECELPQSNQVEVAVMNTLGETVLSKKYIGQSGHFEQRINMNELLPGSYYLRISSEDGVAFLKLIKE